MRLELQSNCPATYLISASSRTLTYRRHVESLRKKLTSRIALLRQLAGSGLGNNAANSHLSPGPFNSRVLRSCMAPQCSYRTHWPCHQRRLANYGWILVFYSVGVGPTPADNVPLLEGIQPAELRRTRATLSPARHGARTSAPLSSHLSTWSECTAPQIKTSTCARRTAAQLLISSSDDNRNAALWADHQWNAQWLENTTRLRIFVLDIGTYQPRMALHAKNSVGPA